MNRVQAPQEQRPSERSAEDRQGVVMALIRTADDLRRYFTASYERYDIAPQQYNVLRILRGAHPEVLPTMEIAERMVEKTPGITRLLDRLHAKQLVIRQRAAEDRRRVLVSISPAGMALLEVMEEPVRAATLEVVEELTDGEVRTLDSLLAKIRSNL